MQNKVANHAFVVVLFVLAFLYARSTVANEAEQQTGKVSDYLRVSQVEGKRHPASFDTAIVRFVDRKTGIKVDLIAAVHVGDKEYYEELNKIFKGYDALLYELVADEKTVNQGKSLASKKDKSLVSGIQTGMSEALALSFQLDYVDYSAKNFVHADLSPEQFAQRLAERQDMMQMLYRLIVLSTQQENEGTDVEMRMQGRLLGTLFVSNKTLALKRFFAREMIQQLDESLWVLVGDEGSAIITDRNDAALKVLKREIQQGKKKLGIFYGGAHLPDFAESLKKEFKMEVAETSWVVAWDLTPDRSARKKER